MAESNAAYGWNPDMPMPLQEKLKEDLKLALRSRHDVLKNAIRQVMSEFFKNKMQAMGVIMKHFGKTADGKLVNQILKDWS